MSNFYERSKRELDDFRDLFHQSKRIGPELASDEDVLKKYFEIELARMDENTKKDRRIFQELCYLMRVTGQQVLDY